jgi:serine/threonine-protein kinase
MAPEQGAGDPAADHRADIYAFGCMAYEVLTGAPPFSGRPPASLLAAHAVAAPEPLAHRRPDVPAALADLVMRCLAKRPDDRPPTAEILHALETVPAGSRPSRRRRLPILAAMIALVAGVAVSIRFRPSPSADADPGAIHSVAVLPFVNTGGDPEDEYFSDGMTDELAHALAGLPELRVAGRTSSYAYKGQPATVQEIGRALGVGGVIAGTVRRSGDRLRVTVQLSSASDGFQRWSHEYERRATEVFEVQDELTRAIVAELEPRLRGSAPRMAEQRGTGDMAAYEHYLRGRFFWARRGTSGLLKALDEYRAAIAGDSSFARAWAGIALTYMVLPSYAPLDADSLTELGIAAARRALALDSTVAEAHLALANALSNQVRLAEAGAEFRRVVALIPNDPTVHQWYSAVLHGQGRVEEALAESRRAAQLDPLSAVILSDQAAVLMSARRYPEAIAAGRRALELDSTFTYAHALIGLVYGLTGRPDSALARLGLDPPKDAGSAWRGSGWRGMAAWAYGIAGRRADLERLRDEIARDPGAQGSYDAAMAAMALGDLEQAVAGLGESLERHQLLGPEPSPGCSPLLDPLHRLRSYQELMRRYGLGICGG